MKNLFFVGLTICSAAALAMPTQQELKKAQPLVVELMAPTMDDFKAKKKTAAEVGEVSAQYAKEAETEAAKFLLLKGAMTYYVRAEDYDKAADAVEALRAGVKNIPPSVLMEIISKTTVRATAKKAPRLFALYRRAKAQSVAEMDIAAFRAKLRQNPGSLPTLRNLAEALATSGDWDAALWEFAKLNDGVAQIAKKELDGSAKSADLGEFWWNYKPTYENADDTFEMRAAVHYRKALAADEITGLKKNIVEQRLKQIPDVEISDALPSQKLARIKLPIEGTDPIVLIPCPGGSFTMGFDKAHVAFEPRKVTLSRPFWMSEAPITVGQYTALMGPFDVLFEPRFGIKPRDGMRRLFKVMGGKSCAISGVNVEEVDSYCAKLSAKYKQLLPQGCIVRLPTEAEWMYAFKCGGSVKESNYAALAQGEEAVNYRAIGVDVRETLAKVIQDAGVSFSSDKHIGYYVPCYRVKTCKPNDWGFYDMPGLCWERLADRASAVHAGSATWNKKGNACFAELNKAFLAGEQVDPILITDDKPGQTLAVMCHQKNWGKWVVESQRCWDVGFRLVIGPDLVSEWKAKNGKK